MPARPRRVAVLVAALTAGSLFGCVTSADRNDARQLVELLRAEPGVSDASVEQEAVNGDVVNRVSIAMDADASVQQVEALLARLPHAGDDVGLDGFLRVEVARGQPEESDNRIQLDVEYDDVNPARAATALVALDERFADLGKATIAGSGAVTLRVAAEVEHAVERILGDPEASGWRNWTVEDAAGATQRLQAERLTQGVLADWLAFSGAFDLVADVQPAMLHLNHGGDRPTYLDVIMRVMPEVPPAELTPDAVGERLRPLFATHVSLVDRLAPGSRLAVRNQSLRASGDTADDLPAVDAVFSIADGGAAVDPLGRGWDRWVDEVRRDR